MSEPAGVSRRKATGSRPPGLSRLGGSRLADGRASGPASPSPCFCSSEWHPSPRPRRTRSGSSFCFQGVVYARKEGYDPTEAAEGERIDAEDLAARVLVQVPNPRRHLVCLLEPSPGAAGQGGEGGLEEPVADPAHPGASSALRAGLSPPSAAWAGRGQHRRGICHPLRGRAGDRGALGSAGGEGVAAPGAGQRSEV
jgi:hypothetical protein